MITKRELFEFLKPFDDDIRIEICEKGCAAGTQKELLDMVYATGDGRSAFGDVSIVLLYAKTPIDGDNMLEDEEKIEAEIKCPHCGEEL